MTRGDVKERADVNFHFQTDVGEQIYNVNSAAKPLGSWIEIIESGSFIAPEKVGDTGVPIVQVNNLTAYELSAPTDRTQFENLKMLEAGDFLTGRVGSIGTFAIFDNAEEMTFSDNILRFRLKSEYEQRSQFLLHYLNSDLTRQQIARFRKGALQDVINQTTLKSIVVPEIDLDEERELISALETARLQRQNNLAQADALLSGLDAWLLEQLGLTPPAPDVRSSFAVTLGDLSADKRISADYYHPERILAIRRQAQNTDLRSERLADIADFVRDQKTIGDEFYLGLANVAPNTGELVEATGEAEGAVFHFQRDDVLFARLRPYLNKVHRAERDGVCSTEFYVLRLHSSQSDDEVLPDYLAVILRSSLTLAQTRHMMTGNTHPRLANEDVANLVVPLPPMPLQQTIAAEVTRRRDQARRLRDQAHNAWKSAKARFEAQLLGGETP